MNESLHDALERIINICNQQLSLNPMPAEATEGVIAIIDKCNRTQRVIRAKDTHNER